MSPVGLHRQPCYRLCQALARREAWQGWAGLSIALIQALSPAGGWRWRHSKTHPSAGVRSQAWQWPERDSQWLGGGNGPGTPSCSAPATKGADQPPLSCTCMSVIPSTSPSVGSLFPVPSSDRTPRPGQAGISFTSAEGNISASLVEASPPGIVALGLEGDSAPSHEHHKPTGVSLPQKVKIHHYIDDVFIRGDCPKELQQQQCGKHYMVQRLKFHLRNVRNQAETNQIGGYLVGSSSAVIPADTFRKTEQGQMPQSQKEIQQLMGPPGCWRKHAPRFSIIARPLYSLL